MANYNLTLQQIRNSFNQLAQVSGSIEAGVSGYAILDGTGSRANTLHVTASYATTASFALNGGGGGSVDTGSLLVTSSASNNIITFTKGDGSTYTNTIDTGSAVTVDTGSLLVTASNVDAVITYTKGDGSVFTNTINNVANATTATSASHAVIADSSLTATSASHAVKADSADSATSASYAVTSSHVTDPNIAYINKNNTFTGTQAFDNISVAGTGSFGYLKTITGSATIIGEQYVILNADSPTARFAGIKVYDSGSGLTGSFEWDSVDDNWIQVETGGSSAGMLTGASGSKGSEVYPTANRLIKGTGNHTVVDSIIVDNGTNATINGDATVTGNTQLNDELNFSTFVNLKQQSVNILTGSASVLKLRSTDFSVTDLSDNVSANFTNTGISIKKGTQITGSLIVSQSGLSSGEDVFVLGAPRGGGSSLEGVIRSTVDDGLHFYGNKFFNNGANTFSGGIIGFESGPVQLGPAGSPVNLEMQNDSAIIATGGTLPITGSVDISGSLAIKGIPDVSASIAAGGGGGSAFPFTGSAGISGSLLIDGEAPNLDINTSVKGGTPNLRMYQAYNGTDVKFANISINDSTGTYSSPSLFGRFSNAVSAFGNAAGDPFTVIAGGAAGGAFNHWGLVLDQTGDIKSLKEMNMYSGAKITGSLDVTGSLVVDGAISSSKGVTVTGFNETSTFNGTITSTQGSIQALGGNGGNALTVGNSGYGLQYPSVNVFTNSGSYGDVYASHRIEDLSGNGDFGTLALSTFNAGDPGRLAFETQFNNDVIWWISENENRFHVEKELKAKAGAQITGSLDINGQVTGGVTSLAIASTTASMDFNDGNFFNLTLANGVDTHLDATNVAAGQTISLVVTNNATGAGTLSFSPDFKFAGGTAPTVTAAVNAVDILTFVTTDATSVYGTGLLNFS